MDNCQYFGLFLDKRVRNKLHNLVFNLTGCTNNILNNQTNGTKKKMD